MIQCISTFKFGNQIINKMFDTGATWYEINSKWKTLYFNTLDEAINYITTEKEN